jgi:hypothetical protein
LVGQSQALYPPRLSVKNTGQTAALRFLSPPTLDLDPVQLYRGYAARFHLEFIFRDVWQFTGGNL